MSAYSDFYNRGHEAEYVLSRPTRKELPIESVPGSAKNSRCNTPGAKTMNSKREKFNGNTDLMPQLVHRWSHSHSILCVIAAPSRNTLFCGTQDSKLLVYDMKNYNLKFEIEIGHIEETASILCLALSDDENFLFSAGSNSLVNVWDITNVNKDEGASITCTHIVYSLVDIGDIFSIAWCSPLSTLFMGAQNASILWCRLHLKHKNKNALTGSTIERLPNFRYDRFFDSKGPGGLNINSKTRQQLLESTKQSQKKRPLLVEVGHEDVIRFAHFGYVYCMEAFDKKQDFAHLDSSSYENTLVTCGGDGATNIWGISTESEKIWVSKLKSMENEESILSMYIQDSYIYLGLSNGSLNVWDLLTYQLVRSFEFPSKEPQEPSTRDEGILSLSISGEYIYRATNSSGLTKLSLRSYTTPVLNEEERGNNNHRTENSNIVVYADDETQFPLSDNSYVEESAVLAIKPFSSATKRYLLAGGNKSLCLWDISSDSNMIDECAEPKNGIVELTRDVSNGDLLHSLGIFISFKTILKYPSLYMEDSRYCAQFLSKLLIKLGSSQTKLLPIPNGNPVVYGKFEKNDFTSTFTPRVLWYSHYDVVDANSSDDYWSTDPFELVAKDGNLYARGVSDNKAPTLAAMYAVSELYQKKKLSCDVIFIIEGEEECGSLGFQNLISDNKALIGEINWVLLSNSYWLDDDTPCLNYGLRGVINTSISVSSDKPDRHSGVDGGVLRELTTDLIQVLSQLTDPVTNKIKIPEFYDDVLPLTGKEMELFRNTERAYPTKNLKTLMAKWRDPSLTIHQIKVSGPNNNTVIPQVAKASISIRIVPNQDLEKIKNLLIAYLNCCFKALQSDNHLLINIFHEAEPWLGDPSNLLYQLLYQNLKKHWGTESPKPSFIREGGSIPSVRFLEKCFNAPAAQIPCGQATDNAHLRNEKLRLLNLFKLRDILTSTFRDLGSKTANKEK